jgi:hypothetical protein
VAAKADWAVKVMTAIIAVLIPNTFIV